MKIGMKFIAMLWVGLMLVCPLIMQGQEHNLPKSIEVNGQVKFLTPSGDNWVKLYKTVISGDPVLVDSVKLNEDKKSFHFTLHQDHPGIYKIDAMGWDFASFWSDANVKLLMRGADTAKIHMKIPHYNFVEGSMDNNFINFYEQISQLDYLRMVDELNQEYYAKKNKEKDSTWIHYLNTAHRYDSLRVDYKKRRSVLFKAYKGRPVLLYALQRSLGPNRDDYEKTLKYLDDLIEKYPWLTEAEQAKNTILNNREMASKIDPGSPLPHIEYPNLEGKVHGLEKYRGKYLLIDFWASWCGPCRAAIPKVKELYATYNPKELNIVSISIDDSKEAWLKAVDDENMPWEQFLSPDKKETMKQFQFGGIPTMYLIDPSGKIIQRFLGYGPGSEKEIKKILENKTVAPKKKKAIKAMGF